MAITPPTTLLITTNEDGFGYFYINYIKNSFVKFLRVAFGSDATPAKYQYDADINKSQFDIRSDYPSRLIKAPICVVEAGPGDASKTYLGDELLRETNVTDDGLDGYLYSGKLTLDVIINIFGGTMRDTEHLTDLTALYVRYLFIKKAAEVNIAYTKVNVSKIVPDDSIPSQVPYFKSTISTTVTSQFTHYIPRNLYQMIQDIDFEIGTEF